ncbi:MAG: hypothetical protein ACYC3S_12565 [Chloroflexota bacterium]
MLQNLVLTLARNPVALKAIADLIAPMTRNLVRQQTNEDLAQVRRELDALTGLAGRDLPAALAGLGARQQELALGLEQLRQEMRDSLSRQAERELSLRSEVDRLRKELATAQAAPRKSDGPEPAPRKWLPW